VRRQGTCRRRRSGLGRPDRPRRVDAEHQGQGTRLRAASCGKNEETHQRQGATRRAIGCGTPQGLPRYTGRPISSSNSS
jgi:hypothetical protein